MTYKVIRHKGVFFTDKKFKKRKKNFGEFLNTQYNNDEYYNENNIRKNVMREFKKCAYCNRNLSKRETSIFCIGCGCQSCKRYDKNLDLYYIEKKKKYLCIDCK